ncbi:hypothetical protein YB2330_000823 [Saitoella coloradoensis]
MIDTAECGRQSWSCTTEEGVTVYFHHQQNYLAYQHLTAASKKNAFNDVELFGRFLKKKKMSLSCESCNKKVGVNEIKDHVCEDVEEEAELNGKEEDVRDADA